MRPVSPASTEINSNRNSIPKTHQPEVKKWGGAGKLDSLMGKESVDGEVYEGAEVARGALV